MGAQVGQAEKRGFQTGQLRGKLIWESTKGWWEYKGMRWTDSSLRDFQHWRCLMSFNCGTSKRIFGVIRNGFRGLEEIRRTRMKAIPEIVPGFWGEREFSGSQLSRKPLSFDGIYIWSRTMLLSEAYGLRLWVGVRQLPSVFTWQHMRVPTAADLAFNHPRGLRCHFLDTVSRQTRKDWPCLSLFRCCRALNLSIMFKFNSSGTDGAHRAEGFSSRWPCQPTHPAFGFLWVSNVSQDDAI